MGKKLVGPDQLLILLLRKDEVCQTCINEFEKSKCEMMNIQQVMERLTAL